MRSAILLSGGMDSVALAYWKRPAVAFTLDYGQLAAAGEIRAATKVAHILQIEHHVIRIPCRELGAGDMAGSAGLACAPVPEWWPFRNQLLVTLACMKAVAIAVSEVMLATVRSDGAHADGTPEFFRCADELCSLQEGRVRITAPAIGMTTEELVARSGIPHDLLGWTHSCHKHAFACGRCRGCWKHLAVRRAIGMEPAC